MTPKESLIGHHITMGIQSWDSKISNCKCLYHATVHGSLIKAVSTGPDMTVLFKTHETSYGQSGSKAIRFSFKWESVTGGASECGNELKGNHGTVSSPGYPTNYPANAQCTWSISLGEDAKYNDHIVLSFKVTKGLSWAGQLNQKLIES